MNVTYEITGVGQTTGRLMGLGDAIRAELTAEMQFIIADLTRYVVDQKLSGQVLAKETGKLAAGVTGSVDGGSDGLIVGRTYVAGVPYARILEQGGTTPPHTILPTAAMALRFPWNDGIRFAAKVNHPGSKIPAFNYLGGALEDMADKIIRELGEAAQRGAAI